MKIINYILSFREIPYPIIRSWVIGVVVCLSFLYTQTLGDLNQDEAVDVLDIVRCVNIILEVPPEPTEYELWAGDMNEDENINVLDIILIVDYILNGNSIQPEWSSYGLESMLINHLEIINPYIYAGTDGNGLWRRYIDNDSSEWEYMGLSALDLEYEYYRIKDIIQNDYDLNEIIVTGSTYIGECVSLSGSVEGCMDDLACNYDDTATEACSDCCEYAEENFDCDGNCIAELDCTGECGGTSAEDECGVCNGSGASFDCGDGTIVCEESECTSTLPGCMDEEALNFNPDATESDDSCLFDPWQCSTYYPEFSSSECGNYLNNQSNPYDYWVQSTTQSFYVINELLGQPCSNLGLESESCVDPIPVELSYGDSSSYFVIGAMCGENNIVVGSSQWRNEGDSSAVVAMGSDGFTPGTEEYCFEGLSFPIVLPADIPTFKIYDALRDIYYDAVFTECFDLSNEVSDCAWANMGFNGISSLTFKFEVDMGCIDSQACNYDDTATEACSDCCEYAEENFDCDGNCIAELDCTGECGGTLEEDECGVCGGEGTIICWDGTETCDINTCSQQPEYFSNIPNPTGSNNIVIIQNVIGLEEGDEIGLFDYQGLISDDCNNVENGQILVGSGVYNNSQLEISATGSIDFCDNGGEQSPGFISNNPIVVKLFKYSNEYEYIAIDVNYSIGNGLWGNLLTIIEEIDAHIYGCTDPEGVNYNEFANIDDDTCIYTVIQEFEFYSNYLNNISFNVVLDDMSPYSIFNTFSDPIISNDNGQYFMPSFDINSIGNINNSDGYLFYFTNGPGFLSIEGVPADLSSNSIELLPQVINYIGYTPQEASFVVDVFQDIPVTIVMNQYGNYYIPEYDINTIDAAGGMKPGLGYMVYQNSDDIIEFTYSENLSKISNSSTNLSELNQSEYFDIIETGNPYPIIIKTIDGDYNIGDEIVAYANNEVIGVSKILNPDENIILTAWGNLEHLDIETAGFSNQDEIVLKIFNTNTYEFKELEHDFNNSYYGQELFSIGNVTVIEHTNLPNSFILHQAYPNPFNPVTNISYGLPMDTQVTLNIYNVEGRKISTLTEGIRTARNHTIEWNAEGYPSGVYFVKLDADRFSETQKLMLVK